MDGNPVLPDISLLHGHDFDSLFVTSYLLVGDIITTAHHEVAEDLGAEFCMVQNETLVAILFKYSKTIFGGSGHFGEIICGEFG